MSQPGAVPTDADLIASAAAGTLIALIGEDSDHAPADSLLNRAAALHNGRRLDLLDQKQVAVIDAQSAQSFFATQHIWCEIIPKLNASVAAMMVVVKRLVEKGDADGAALFPLQAFKAWLAADITRADAILAAFTAGSTDDAAYLAAALEARADPALVVPFLHTADPRRQFAASALAAIPPANDTAADAALTELLPLAQTDPHDMTRFTAIYGSGEILGRAEALAPVWIPRLIAAVAANPSNRTTEALLQGLWRRTKLYDDQMVSDALALAMAADLSDLRMLNILVVTLGHLLTTPHRDKALDDLTTLLETGVINLENRNGPILYRFHAMDPQQIFALVVRWLGSSSDKLCEAAVDIATKGGQATPFAGDLGGMNLTSDQIILVCQRAVGYFFLHPVAAASILLAGLRAKDIKATPILTNILYFPLLVNYLGSVQDYLKTIRKGDVAWTAVRKVLKQADGYMKGAETKGPIKELAPSDFQRNISRERQIEMSREMHKQVRKESVLLSLVHESVVLHGRSTMSFVRGTDQPPMVMPMHAYSHSVELPRLDILDPVGLAWMLWRFKRAGL